MHLTYTARDWQQRYYGRQAEEKRSHMRSLAIKEHLNLNLFRLMIRFIPVFYCQKAVPFISKEAKAQRKVAMLLVP